MKERSHSYKSRYYLEEEGKPVVPGDAWGELAGRAGRRDYITGQARAGRFGIEVGPDGGGSDYVHGARGDCRA